jgi:hypothetical protein
MRGELPNLVREALNLVENGTSVRHNRAEFGIIEVTQLAATKVRARTGCGTIFHTRSESKDAESTASD